MLKEEMHLFRVVIYEVQGKKKHHHHLGFLKIISDYLQCTESSPLILVISGNSSI